MMKKLIFAFVAAAILFIGGQTATAHADTTNDTEHAQTTLKVDVKKQHPKKSTDNKTTQINDVDSMFVNLSDSQNESSSSDDMIASFSPQTYLTSNKHFKVPETDTIDGDGETTDPSKGYAMNHYTGDNVNGDAQVNDHIQPKQGQQV